MIEAYPLTWPSGHARTARPQTSRFDTTMARARDGVVAEVERLGGTGLVISSNIPVRKDGLPRGDWERRSIIDHGVAVYFQYQGEPVALCCDKWNSVEDNMQALYKTIEAMRALDRWGVSDMLKRAFTGFSALPVATERWYEVLGVAEGSSYQAVKNAYRELVKRYHSDTGTDANRAEFERVQRAWEAFQLI